jgi:hypothetical protein
VVLRWHTEGDEVVLSQRRRIAVAPTVLVAWAVAAALFAWRRIPFYDEWYSITLAHDATWPEFKASLAADLHPPWLALLDRALIAVWPDRRVLAFPRLAASLAAILILRRVVLRQWPRVGLPLATLAAFHPVVFMYAGAVRWYPFAFLADALRAWALWGTSNRRATRVAFFAGAMLGVASGYAEGLLAAVDAAWLMGRERDRGAAATIAATGAAALATVLAAPFVPGWPLPGPSGKPFLLSLVTWAALGPLGSVVVPWPFTPVILLALPGLVWGLACALKDTPARPFSLWIVSVAASWAALANRVEHPRYSLALWFLTTCALGLLRGSRFAHAARLASASYLGLALWLTVRQHDFAFKDDNEMAPSDCALLVPPPSTLVVTSYLRTAEELHKVCDVHDVTSARNGRIYAPRADLIPIHGALRAGRVTFVHTNAPGSLLADVNERLRDMLAERCKLEDVRQVAPSPLARLRRVFKPEAPRFHYASERWVCDD